MPISRIICDYVPNLKCGGDGPLECGSNSFLGLNLRLTIFVYFFNCWNCSFIIWVVSRLYLYKMDEFTITYMYKTQLATQSQNLI